MRLFRINREECGDPICQPVFWCKQCSDSAGGQSAYGQQSSSAIGVYGTSGSALSPSIGPSSGAQDSYGIPQGAPISGGSSLGSSSGSQDSYGIPQGAPVGSGASSGSSSAQDSYGIPSGAPVSSQDVSSSSNYGSPQVLSGTSSVVKSGPSTNPLLNSGGNSFQANENNYGAPSPIPTQQTGDSYGSPTSASEVSNSYGSPQSSSSINEASNSYGSPSAQPSPPLNSYGSPQPSSVSPVSSSYGAAQNSPISNEVSNSNSYGSPSVQPSPTNPAPSSYDSPQNVPISNPSSDVYGSPNEVRQGKNYDNEAPAVPFSFPSSQPSPSPSGGGESQPAQTSYGSASPASIPSTDTNNQAAEDTYGSPSSAPTVAQSGYGSPSLVSGSNSDSLSNANSYDSPSSVDLSDTLSNSLSDSYNSNTLGIASSATGPGRESASSGESNPITFSPSPSTVPFGILKSDADSQFLIDYSLGSKSNGGGVTPSFTVPSVLPPPDRKELDQLTPVNSHPHSLPHSSNEIDGSGDDSADFKVEDGGDDFSNLVGDYIDDSYGEPDPDQIDDSIETYKPQQDSYQALSSDFDYSYADSFTKYTNNNLMIDLRGRSRSDKNYGAPDLVVDNSAPISYGDVSRNVRFV